MAAIISWLLPEPDSPTIATVSPGLHVELTPFTASTDAVERARKSPSRP